MTDQLSAEQAAAIRDLTAALLETETQPNQAVSGLSAWMLLCVLYAGSGGVSSTGLEALLGAGDDDLAQKWAEVNAELEAATGLRHSSAVWSKVPLMPEFVQTFQRAVEFSSEVDQRALDAWVVEATDGLLQRFPIEVSDDTEMALADALSLRARWHDEFSKRNTAPRTFYVEGGDEVTCDFMNRSSSLHSATFADRYVAWLASASGSMDPDASHSHRAPSYSVQFVMPVGDGTKADALAASLQHLDGDKGDGSVKVALPKFGVEARADLLGILERSPASVILTDDADFTGLSPTPLKVGDAKQDVILRIDEEGFEAAAVTAAEMLIGRSHQSSDRVEHIVFDRPFAVSVLETRSGLPLFTAWIGNPAV